MSKKRSRSPTFEREADELFTLFQRQKFEQFKDTLRKYSEEKLTKIVTTDLFEVEEYTRDIEMDEEGEYLGAGHLLHCLVLGSGNERYLELVLSKIKAMDLNKQDGFITSDDEFDEVQKMASVREIAFYDYHEMLDAYIKNPADWKEKNKS